MFYKKSRLPLILRRVVQKHDSFNKVLRDHSYISADVGWRETISSFNDKSRAKEAPFTSNGQFQTGKSRRTSMYIYSTQLYFTGLPVREASQCLSLIIKRNHVSI
jgi:hypothetical protein